jgi:hypothetical protein
VSGMGMQRYWAGILVLGMAGAGLARVSTQTAEQAPAAGTSTYKPNFPGDPARSDSEAQALGYMRTFLRAQREYKKRHDKYATSLEALGGTGSFTKRMAATTDRGDYKAGFRVHEDGFIFTMTPNHMDSEHRSFYAEEDGVIHGDDQKAADMSSPKIR